MIALIFCTLLVGITSLYVLFAVISWRYAFCERRKCQAQTTSMPSVSIIKPMRGITEATYSNLASHCQQKYSAPYEILFAIAQETDPSVALVHQLQHDFPLCRIRLVFSNPTGPGLEKIRNVAAAERVSQYDVIICTDSDVRVSPHFLKQMIAPLADEQVGLVTSAYHYRSPPNAGAWLEAIFVIRVSALMLFWGAQRNLKGVLGGCYALPRKVLQEIGGFQALATAVADDLPLGRLVRRQGYRIHLLPWSVDVYPGRETTRGFFWRMVRWYIVTRFTSGQFFWSILPFNFLPVILALFYGLLSIIKSDLAVSAALLLGWAVALRLLAMAGTAIFFLQDPWLLTFSWLTIPLDLVDAMIWIAAAFRTSFTWGETAYKIIQRESGFGIQKCDGEMSSKS